MNAHAHSIHSHVYKAIAILYVLINRREQHGMPLKNLIVIIAYIYAVDAGECDASQPGVLSCYAVNEIPLVNNTKHIIHLDIINSNVTDVQILFNTLLWPQLRSIYLRNNQYLHCAQLQYMKQITDYLRPMLTIDCDAFTVHCYSDKEAILLVLYVIGVSMIITALITYIRISRGVLYIYSTHGSCSTNPVV